MKWDMVMRSVEHVVMAGPTATVEPGQDAMLETEPLRSAFRPSRMVVIQKYGPVRWDVYQRGVGGSKRKGRHASLRYFAERLNTTPNRGRLVIDNLRVGQSAQMVPGHSIPAEVFSPGSVDTHLNLDIAKPGIVIALGVTNGERSRNVTVNVTYFGTVPT